MCTFNSGECNCFHSMKNFTTSHVYLEQLKLFRNALFLVLGLLFNICLSETCKIRTNLKSMSPEVKHFQLATSVVVLQMIQTMKSVWIQQLYPTLESSIQGRSAMLYAMMIVGLICLIYLFRINTFYVLLSIFLSNTLVYSISQNIQLLHRIG